MRRLFYEDKKPIDDRVYERDRKIVNEHGKKLEELAKKTEEVEKKTEEVEKKTVVWSDGGVVVYKKEIDEKMKLGLSPEIALFTVLREKKLSLKNCFNNLIIALYVNKPEVAKKLLEKIERIREQSEEFRLKVAIDAYNKALGELIEEGLITEKEARYLEFFAVGEDRFEETYKKISKKKEMVFVAERVDSKTVHFLGVLYFDKDKNGKRFISVAEENVNGKLRRYREIYLESERLIKIDGKILVIAERKYKGEMFKEEEVPSKDKVDAIKGDTKGINGAGQGGGTTDGGGGTTAPGGDSIGGGAGRGGAGLTGGPGGGGLTGGGTGNGGGATGQGGAIAGQGGGAGGSSPLGSGAETAGIPIEPLRANTTNSKGLFISFIKVNGFNNDRNSSGPALGQRSSSSGQEAEDTASGNNIGIKASLETKNHPVEMNLRFFDTANNNEMRLFNSPGAVGLREINPEEAKALDSRAEVSDKAGSSILSIQGNTHGGDNDTTTGGVVMISAPKTMFGVPSLGRTSLSGLKDALLQVQAIMGNLRDKIKAFIKAFASGISIAGETKHIFEPATRVVVLRNGNNGQGFDSKGISIKTYRAGSDNYLSSLLEALKEQYRQVITSANWIRIKGSHLKY